MVCCWWWGSHVLTPSAGDRCCFLPALLPLTCFSLNMDHPSKESSVVLLPPEWSFLVLNHLCESDGVCRFNCVLSDDEAKPSVVQCVFCSCQRCSSNLRMVLQGCSSFSSSCCCVTFLSFVFVTFLLLYTSKRRSFSMRGGPTSARRLLIQDSVREP